MINARDMAKLIRGIPPGERIAVSKIVLSEIYIAPGYDCAAEYIMEQIVGSSFEFHYTVDQITGDVTFIRLKEPLRDGRRTWVSPDRRYLYRFENGFYVR